jgi:ATP-dependent DNA helicase RecG
VLVTLYGRGEGVVPAGVGPMGTIPIGAVQGGASTEHRPLMAQNQRVERLMAFLRQSGQITNREYQELCPGVSSETLRRDFSELVDQGLILRVGDKRGTYYIARQR